jgi:hypothetical protein
MMSAPPGYRLLTSTYAASRPLSGVFGSHLNMAKSLHPPPLDPDVGLTAEASASPDGLVTMNLICGERCIRDGRLSLSIAVTVTTTPVASTIGARL